MGSSKKCVSVEMLVVIVTVLVPAPTLKSVIEAATIVVSGFARYVLMEVVEVLVFVTVLIFVVTVTGGPTPRTEEQYAFAAFSSFGWMKAFAFLQNVALFLSVGSSIVDVSTGVAKA